MNARVLCRCAALTMLAGLALPAMGQATTNPTAANPQAPAPVKAVKPKPSKGGWWNNAVFYQIFVRSFADSRTGPLAGDGVGDFTGIVDRMDYINDGRADTADDLGATALWLMPMMESPSYHGYDVKDYYAVDKEYGTTQDFVRFMTECRARNIRVILDFVPNHCSSENPWFLDAQDPKSRKRDWFIWSKTLPTWKGPWNQEVWHPTPPPDGHGKRADGVTAGAPYYYGIFSPVMPDLNYRNSEATREMFNVVQYWMKDMQVDGFRLDAIRHLIEKDQIQENTPETHEWLKKYYKHTKSVKPDAFSVGEVWSSTEVVASYIGDELDSCFEFDVSYATIDAINNADATRLNNAVTKAWGMIPRNQYSSFLSNHDQTRVATRFGGDAAKAKLGAALLFTLPGIPFMYYGEELGMTGDKPDENLRTPMQWSNQINAGFTTGTPWRAPNQGYQRQNVAGQARDPNSILSNYRNLIRLRLANPALLDGDFAAVETSDNKVLAFLRSPATTARGDASFLIVANLSGEPIKGAKLSMKESPLRRAKMRDAWDEKIEIAAPKLTTRGGFEGFVPVEELAPRSVTIIKVLN